MNICKVFSIEEAIRNLEEQTRLRRLEKGKCQRLEFPKNPPKKQEIIGPLYDFDTSTLKP